MKEFYTKNKTRIINDIAGDIIDAVIEDMNNGNYTDLERCIFENIDRKLIYYRDMWEIMRIYQNPTTANFNEAVEALYCDVYENIELDYELTDEEIDDLWESLIEEVGE